MAENNKQYTTDFKKQIVSLHLDGGRKPSELAKEYGIANSSISKWVRDFKNSGSFKAKDNRSPEEELIRLRKENKQLRMELDILKQAALDNGSKIDIIKANKDKHSVVKLCKLLEVPRSVYYYQPKE